MKINFGQALKTLEGEELKYGEKALALKVPAVNALMGAYEDERNLSGEEKVKRYDLAMRITSITEPDLTAEETALIKKLIAKAYSPLVVGQAWKMLENKP